MTGTQHLSIMSNDKDSNKMHDADLEKVVTCHNGEVEQTIGQPGTKRDIKSRHAQMIAIGGAIGTSLFVGSGQALAVGGPGYLLICYCLISLMVYAVITAIIEVGTYLPVPGASMAYYATRVISPSVGFALGWLYFYSFGIIVAYEITAAAIIIDYWPSSIHTAVWITIMIIVIIGLNLSPVGVYAETEFWFAGIKVIMIIGLLVLSLVLMLGGGPTHDRLGFRFWSDPGAFNTLYVGGSGGYFTAFLYVWLYCGISFFFGPEMVISMVGEMRNPRKNLPRASRQYFGRLVVFYILGAVAIGATCISTSEGLISGQGNANASPWVIAIRNASIPILPSIINAGILTSAWSAGNAYLYLSSRSLYSLSLAGNAPKVFTRCTRYGLPIYAVAASSCFTLLSYLSVSSQAGQVFNWFVSLTNTSGYTSWAVCCVILLRFRKACNFQGVTLPYRARIQPWASWICLPIFVFLLLTNGFTVFYPGHWKLDSFLTNYLGIPISLILWLGHKFTVGKMDSWIYDSSDVDLKSGLAEVEAEAENWNQAQMIKNEQKGEKGNTWWKKIRLC